MLTHQVSLVDEIGGNLMSVICKECEKEMEFREKYGSKNKGVYKCLFCGNLVFEDTMEKKVGETIIIVPNEEI